MYLETPGGQVAAPGDLMVKHELCCFGTKFSFQQEAAVAQGTGSPPLTGRRWHRGEMTVEGFWDRDLPASKEDIPQDKLPGHECVDTHVRGRENPQEQTLKSASRLPRRSLCFTQERNLLLLQTYKPHFQKTLALRHLSIKDKRIRQIWKLMD